METLLDIKVKELWSQLAEEKNELQKITQEMTEEQLEELNWELRLYDLLDKEVRSKKEIQ